MLIVIELKNMFSEVAGQLTEAVASLTEGMADMKKNFDAVPMSIQHLKADLETFKEETNQIGLSVKNMFGGNSSSLVGGLNEGVLDIQESLDRVPNSMKQLEDKLNALKNNMANSFSLSEIRKFKEEIKQTENQLAQLSNHPSKDFMAKLKEIPAKFGDIAKSVGGAFGLSTIQDFGKEVLKVYGDAQKFGLSMQYKLGSKSDAKAVVSDVEKFAATSPFEESKVKEASQKLVGSGVGG